MKHYLLLLAFCAGIILLQQPGSAFSPSNQPLKYEGTNFWLCFQKNYRDVELESKKKSDPVSLHISITSRYDTKVIIESQTVHFSQTIDLEAGKVVHITLDTALQLRSSERIEKLTLHITSARPISVYGLNQRFQTTDSFLGLPVEFLGTQYRVMGAAKLSDDLLSQCAVVATEEKTTVTITPSTSTQGGKVPKEPFTIILNQGEVFQMMADPKVIQSDLTGTLISADKKIAVFSGHNCAYVPTTLIPACNHLVEQLLPVNAWGKEYFLGQLESRLHYTFRVVATLPGTKIMVNGREVAILQAGEYYEAINVSNNIHLMASEIVSVAQYSQGFKDRDSVGDPMMMMIRSTNEFQNMYHFATPVAEGSWHHYLNITVPSAALASLRIDGNPADQRLFYSCEGTESMIGQVEISAGAHTIECDKPCGMSSYGFGYANDAYDAYGNM